MTVKFDGRGSDFQEEIFPDSDGGTLYEKYISSDQPPFDLELDVPPSEEHNISTLLTDEDEAEVDGPADGKNTLHMISAYISEHKSVDLRSWGYKIRLATIRLMRSVVISNLSYELQI